MLAICWWQRVRGRRDSQVLDQWRLTIARRRWRHAHRSRVVLTRGGSKYGRVRCVIATMFLLPVAFAIERYADFSLVICLDYMGR
jgi:hypothetical protein